MTEAEIERIAEEIPIGPYRLMMDVGIGKLQEAQIRNWFSADLLIDEGLLTFRLKWWIFGERVFYLTPLGLAVRAYLEKSDGV